MPHTHSSMAKVGKCPSGVVIVIPLSLVQVVSSPNLGGPSSPSLSRFHSSPGPPGLEDSEPSGPIGVYGSGGGGSAGPASPTAAAAAAYEAAPSELFIDSLASCRTEPSEDQEVAHIMAAMKAASAAATAAATAAGAVAPPRRRPSDDAPPLLAQASAVQPLTQVASSRSATPVQGGVAPHTATGGGGGAASRSTSPAPGHLHYQPHTKQAALAGGAASSPSLAAAAVVQAASSSATAKLTANRHTTVMSAPLTPPAASAAAAGGSSGDPFAAAFAHLGPAAANSTAGAGGAPELPLPLQPPLSHSAAGAPRLPHGHSADALPQVAGTSQQEAAAVAAASGCGSQTVVILPRMMSVNQGAIFQGPGAAGRAGGTTAGGAGASGMGLRPGSPGGHEAGGQQSSSGPLPKVALGHRGRGPPAHDTNTTTDHQPPAPDSSQHTTTSLLPAISGPSGPHHQNHHHQHGSHGKPTSTPPLNTTHTFRSSAALHHPHRAPLYAAPSTHTGRSRDLLGYISTSLVTPMDNVLGPLSGPGRASQQRTAHHPRSPGSRMVPGLGVSLRDLAGVNDVRVQQRRGEGGGSGDGGHGGGHHVGGVPLPLELDDGAPPLEDRALSAPSLQDINYILSRWTARCVTW